MDNIFKAIAGVLVALVVCQILQLREKNISVLLVMAVCCMVFAIAGTYIEQIIRFIFDLETLGRLNSDTLQIMLKCAGICLLSELSMIICQDCGNGALGKMIQILSSACVICLCLPVFTELISLVQTILEAA